MRRRNFLKSLGFTAAGFALRGVGGFAAGKKKRPNIVVILSDDQGYGDVSYHKHPKEVRTPHIDRLARSSVRLTDGYASAYVCAPTRAGLLTGRYQQRFGFYTAGDSRQGMPVKEITIADLLRKEGYATGVFGKWHVGLEEPYRPLARGFDEFYGFLGHGAHDYFDLKSKPEDEANAMRRNAEIIDDKGYLTDNLGREACAFVERHKDEPFFLYLPFNAVHWPMQAPEEDVKPFDTGDPERDILMGMLKRMDVAIGDVLDALDKAGVRDNTLVFYFSDNGGAAKNHSNNMPLRDYKQSCYEGGLRVPFCVSWPAELKPGECGEPIISLDIFPTICAAAGIETPSDRVYDGRDMLPHLRGEAKAPLHERLFWDGNDNHWAVREGKWKIVFTKQGKIELFDLEADIGEQTDLAAKHPGIAKRLENHYRAWRKEMGTPMGDKKAKRTAQPGGNAGNRERRRNREKE